MKQPKVTHYLPKNYGFIKIIINKNRLSKKIMLYTRKYSIWQRKKKTKKIDGTLLTFLPAAAGLSPRRMALEAMEENRT